MNKIQNDEKNAGDGERKKLCAHNTNEKTELKKEGMMNKI